MTPKEKCFDLVLDNEMNTFVNELLINRPPGIAINLALKENIFSMIVAIETLIPLILLGQPGSSKTLSFNLILDRLKVIPLFSLSFCLVRFVGAYIVLFFCLLTGKRI